MTGMPCTAGNKTWEYLLNTLNNKEGQAWKQSKLQNGLTMANQFEIFNIIVSFVLLSSCTFLRNVKTTSFNLNLPGIRQVFIPSLLLISNSELKETRQKVRCRVFWSGVIFYPMTFLQMPGEIFGCHRLKHEWYPTIIWQLEVRKVSLKNPVMNKLHFTPGLGLGLGLVNKGELLSIDVKNHWSWNAWTKRLNLFYFPTVYLISYARKHGNFLQNLPSIHLCLYKTFWKKIH